MTTRMCRICGLTEEALKLYWRNDNASNPKQCYLVWRRAGAGNIVPECLSYRMGITNPFGYSPTDSASTAREKILMIEKRMKLINEKDRSG